MISFILVEDFIKAQSSESRVKLVWTMPSRESGSRNSKQAFNQSSIKIKPLFSNKAIIRWLSSTFRAFEFFVFFVFFDVYRIKRSVLSVQSVFDKRKILQFSNSWYLIREIRAIRVRNEKSIRVCTIWKAIGKGGDPQGFPFPVFQKADAIGEEAPGAAAT